MFFIIFNKQIDRNNGMNFVKMDKIIYFLTKFHI